MPAFARGEYLMFVDDDDVLYPDAFPLLLAEMGRHPESALVQGEVLEFVREPAPRPEQAPRTWALDAGRFLIWNQIKSPGQVLMRRRAFEAVGGFDTSVWGSDDWDLWQRLLARYPGRGISRPVLAYRLHAENASRDIARMYRSALRVARTHVGRVPPARRALARHASYGQLRVKHVAQLADQVRREARARAWRRAASAAGALALAVGLDLGARVAVKAHLVRRGRWRLPLDDPFARHTGPVG
jgi:glycosyltransferase involved in cell wall biosynthesis